MKIKKEHIYELMIILILVAAVICSFLSTSYEHKAYVGFMQQQSEWGVKGSQAAFFYNGFLLCFHLILLLLVFKYQLKAKTFLRTNGIQILLIAVHAAFSIKINTQNFSFSVVQAEALHLMISGNILVIALFLMWEMRMYFYNKKNQG